jgi:hypothetical protein
MGRRLVLLLAGALIACNAGGRQEAAVSPPPMTPEQSTILEDSVRRLVQRYEAGEVALAKATQELADLIEPVGGFAVQGKRSPQATELYEAASRELRRRDAKRLGVPDSLLTN